jgi:hypothetical protein
MSFSPTRPLEKWALCSAISLHYHLHFNTTITTTTTTITNSVTHEYSSTPSFPFPHIHHTLAPRTFTVLAHPHRNSLARPMA